MIVRTLGRWLIVLAVMFGGASLVHAQYQIQLRAEAGSSQSHLDDRSAFYFNPGMGAATTAFITLSSPNDLFQSYVNHPDSILARYTPQSSTADVVEEANGTWELTVEDGVDMHIYSVEMSLSFPFEELPYFTSSTLANGHPIGPLDWTLVGRDGAFPNGSASITASLWTTGFGERLDQADLPITATDWTPSADFTLEQGYIGAISARGNFAVTSLLSVESITPLTPDAPNVVFTSFSLRYLASLSASLEPAVVPEPSSILLTLIGFSGFALLKWRSFANPTHG